MMRIIIDTSYFETNLGGSTDDRSFDNVGITISKYMGQRLKDLGVSVTIDRIHDEDLLPYERGDKIFDSCSELGEVYVISNHMSVNGDGTEVIYPLRDDGTLPSLVLNEISRNGQNIRAYYSKWDCIDLPENATMHEDDYTDCVEDAVKIISAHLNIPYVLPINEDYNTYTVISGDTLWSIAKKFSVTVDDLKVANELKSNLLNIGQIIRIPIWKPLLTDDIVYTVKAGDNLYSIARNYDKTVDELMEYNGLKSNLLSIGQIIKIPRATVDVTYVVKSGDNLYKIANQFNVTVDDLVRKNNLDSTDLSVGQILNI